VKNTCRVFEVFKVSFKIDNLEKKKEVPQVVSDIFSHFFIEGMNLYKTT